MSEFRILDEKTFKNYIAGIKIKRKIKLIQLHHTYSPSYAHFDGQNHVMLQKNMKNHHVNTNGWADIAQHFTVFPDGKIITGRSLESAPAGIYGANANGICVECLGNFDKGGDEMTQNQKNAVVAVVKVLLDAFGLKAENGVTYHAWWSADGREIGDYVKGHSIKTCPGTNFFGGNSLTCYEKNLMPLVKNYKTDALCEVAEISDIIKVLNNAGIVSNSEMWTAKCNEDINVYWLCRKMANRIKNIA